MLDEANNQLTFCFYGFCFFPLFPATALIYRSSYATRWNIQLKSVTLNTVFHPGSNIRLSMLLTISLLPVNLTMQKETQMKELRIMMLSQKAKRTLRTTFKLLENRCNGYGESCKSQRMTQNIKPTISSVSAMQIHLKKVNKIKIFEFLILEQRTVSLTTLISLPVITK